MRVDRAVESALQYDCRGASTVRRRSAPRVPDSVLRSICRPQLPGWKPLGTEGAQQMHPHRTTNETSGTAPDVRNSQMMRRVNTAFARLAHEGESDTQLAFFCECSSEDCYSVVWMTPTAFDAHVASDDGW